MQKEIMHVERYCDICGRSVSSFAKVSETTPVEYTLKASIYYGGQKHYNELCEECNTAITLLIDKLKEAGSNGK